MPAASDDLGAAGSALEKVIQPVRPIPAKWFRGSSLSTISRGSTWDSQASSSSSSTSLSSTTLSPVSQEVKTSSSSFSSFSSSTSSSYVKTVSRRSAMSPTTNVYTHCGRHTDQYLFGGRSMSDLWRSAFGGGREQRDGRGGQCKD